MRKTDIYTAIQQKFRNHWPGNLSKTIVASLLAAATYGQGVGINTTTPDPSAALDIQATDKGILIPRVYLQDGVDGTTVPNPANGLIIYNTNKTLVGGDGDLNGEGLYQNTGTPASPNWQSVAKFRFPVNRSVVNASGGTAFRINDFSQSTSATTLHTYSQAGYALLSEGKIRIAGPNQEPGSGKVLSSDGSGNASWEGGTAFELFGILTNGAHILAPNVSYRVPFANEHYDKTNSYHLHGFNPSDAFVAPTSAIYHFNTSVSWATGNLQAIVSFIRQRDGVKQVLHSYGGPPPYSASIDVDLLINDLVYIEIIHANTENIDLLTDRSHFSGHFVQAIK